MFDALFVTLTLSDRPSFMVICDSFETYGDDFLFTLAGRPVLYFPSDLVRDIRYRRNDTAEFVSIMGTTQGGSVDG